MPDTAALPRRSLLLASLAVLAILVIVVGPFLFVREANRQSSEAAKVVDHTYAVDAAANALMYALRNRESAALAYGFGHDSAAIRARLLESGQQVPADLRLLTTLTRDNPEQQVRVGRLTSLAEQRGLLIDKIMQGTSGGVDRGQVTALLENNALREVAREIAKAEKALLGERLATARRLASHSTMVTWVAMALQLLLLGGLGLLLARLLGARRSAELAASRWNGRAQAVLQTVREPVVVLDHKLCVVMHNPAFSEVFGIEGSAVGQPIETVGDGAWTRQDIRRRLMDVLGRNRELWDHELLYRDGDGRERALMVNARRMSLPDSEDQVALVTATDVTAHKAADLRVRELNRQLQGKVDQVSEVNRELEAFSYSVSHDLRAPLRHIGGFADKLGRHLGDGKDEKTSHYLQTISNSARRMSRLIDDLLVYSRLGRSALRLQPVDLQSVVEELRAMLDANNATDHPGHHIDWRIAPLPVMVGDENMLRQVWLNLLGNAVKYSVGSQPAVIEVAFARLDNEGYRFTVSDNGVGFDMAYSGKLFGVFQRLHSVSEFEGTGIGLASVRRVLARHGGHIEADAAPGLGARFTFTLPASPDAPLPDPTP